MNSVNPELGFEEPGEHAESRNVSHRLSIRSRVRQLFGTENAGVVKAVGEFLQKNPGTFDHHRLRIIAAAAPHIGDDNHTATLVRELGETVTRFDIAIRPLDLELTRSQFAEILSHFKPITRRKLVADLVVRTTIETLDDVPVEAYSEGAIAFVRKDLLRGVSTSLEDAAKAIASPFATREMVVAALDLIESRLDPSSETSAAVMRLSLDPISHIMSRAHPTATESDVLRAWSLGLRCARGADNLVILLEAALQSPVLLRQAPRELFEQVKRLQGEFESEQAASEAAWTLVNAPELPEIVASDVARFTGPYESAYIPVSKIGALRTLHYTSNDELLTPMSGVEMDGRLLSARTALRGRAVREMRDPEALADLARDATSLRPVALNALITHPSLPTSSLRHLLATMAAPESRYWKDGKPNPDLASLLVNDRLNDEDLASTLDGLSGDKRSSAAMILVDNPAIGWNVCERMADDRELLLHIASNSKSRRAQSFVADMSLRHRDAELATALLANGTISADADRELREAGREWGVSLDPPGIVVPGRRLAQSDDTYCLADVIETALVDGVSDRIDHIVDYISSGGGSFDDLRRTERLAECGMLDHRHWQKLTEVPDTKRALRFAANKLCPKDVDGVRLLAERCLSETADALQRGLGTMPAEKKLRSWVDLPSLEDELLPRTRVTELLEGREVDGAMLEFPVTGRDLRRLSVEMHNCLDDSIDRAMRGDVLVASAGVAHDKYAVMWEVGGGRSSGVPLSVFPRNSEFVDGDGSEDVSLQPIEINSKWNAGNVSSAFRVGIGLITFEFNDGTLDRVAREAAEREVHDGSRTDVSSRGAWVRKRPPTRQRLDLGVGHREAPATQSSEAHLDASSSAGVTELDAVINVDSPSELGLTGNDPHDPTDIDPSGHMSF